MRHPSVRGNILPLLLLFHSSFSLNPDVHLTSKAQGYLTVIQGFATQLECVLSSCSKNVNWYKDDVLIFNSTKFVPSSIAKEESYLLDHSIDFDHAAECSSSCSDGSSSCPEGSSCLDNVCCPCAKEQFTLILKNLTFEDTARYRCQVEKESELLEFQVEVLESGLRGGFHHNISYDHSVCCEEKGISPLCKAMCKPSEMEHSHFDPTSCKTEDYKNFLSCATEGGNRSHVHCCKTQLVPSFCYDLCSNDFTMLRRSHRLCLYYLPEIFDCYNRAYLPFPDPPEEVVVNAVESDQLEVCWKPPKTQKSNAEFPVEEYTVYFKQIPSFPFLGAGNDDGFPLLSSDYSDLLSGTDYEETENIEKRKRDVQTIIEDFDMQMEEREEKGTREKRQTLVFVARDDATNTSTVREFTFKTLNTTNTCATIVDLRSATRYIVYVTSRNGYGASVPSIRSIASTNIVTISSNATMPDTMKCCNENGVSSYCSSKMCPVDSAPSSLAVISIATSCRNEWPKVSPCIADGRNHTDCCVRKNVQKDCLPICGGSAESLGVHAVLCLNLDLSAIYQCLREGYETHPSPPINVRVVSVSESSAHIEWDEPEANSHLVQNYTLFIRKNQHGSPVREIVNAMSPHLEMDLEWDASYAVSVQSHSEKGVSLPSTTVLFQTRQGEDRVCARGRPLAMSDGKPFLCALPSNPCPIHYTCTENDEDDSFCCPDDEMPSTLSFESCCHKVGVAPECLSACNHNSSSFPPSCNEHLNQWIKCASSGHDHSRCCLQEEIGADCLSACSHPFQVPDSCVAQQPKLSRCFSTHYSMIPVAVRNVQVSSLNATSVSLKWDRTPNMKEFEVQLFSGGVVSEGLNTSDSSLVLSALSPSTQYAARVIAYNAAGAAPPSFNISFKTPSIDVWDASLPSAPRGLLIVWNKGTRVNMTWNAVTSTVGGAPLSAPPLYTLYFLHKDKEGQWQTMRSNETWAVMGELEVDSLYSVYVVAAEGESISAASNQLTLTAQSDSFGLPEAEIEITPTRSNGVYTLGEKISINCSIDPIRLSVDKFNIDLTIGEELIANEPGIPFVVSSMETTESLDSVSCSVSSSDGRQNVAKTHILVKFGPTVKMAKAKIRAFDDLSADITCIVDGFPLPSVQFEHNGHGVIGQTRVRHIASNSYAHTLVVQNVTGRAGVYTCKARREKEEKSDTAELLVSTGLLPVNPRMIYDCCEKEGVEGDCLDLCMTGKEDRSNLNCSKYATSLLKCASDNRDHGDCCLESGVSNRCLPLCSGDSFSPNIDCSSHAVNIMSCFIKGHASVPLRPENVKVVWLGGNRVRVEWDHYLNDNSYVYYAVYYKKFDDDSDDYRVQKTRSDHVELDMDGESKWDIGVTAANAYGHSPLTFTLTQPSQSTSKPSSFFFFIIFLIIIVVCVTVLYIGRRLNQTGTSLSTILTRNRGVARDDPTVAFENPGFGNDLGEEVAIRGLGGVAASDWQRNDLEATNNGGNGGEPTSNENGMRYSKLRV